MLPELAVQRKQLEDELKQIEYQRLAIEKQLLLLKSGFKEIQVATVSPTSSSQSKHPFLLSLPLAPGLPHPTSFPISPVTRPDMLISIIPHPSGLPKPKKTSQTKQTGTAKRKQPAASKPSSRSPKVVLPDSDQMWKTCERILNEVKSYNKEMSTWFLIPVKREVRLNFLKC